MKHNINNKNEMFFKNLASLYAEKSGNELKKELSNLTQSAETFSPEELNKFDEKVKGRIRTNQVKKWTARLMPIAACFIIVLTVYIINVGRHINNLSANSDSLNSSNSAVMESNNHSMAADYEFLSAKLPPNYVLRKIDYDYKKVIYYIINEEGVEIILTIEEYNGKVNTDGLDEIKINDKTAYGRTTYDFTFLQYKKDNYLYMLTSPYYDYDDLIKISENLI